MERRPKVLRELEGLVKAHEPVVICLQEQNTFFFGWFSYFLYTAFGAWFMSHPFCLQWLELLGVVEARILSFFWLTGLCKVVDGGSEVIEWASKNGYPFHARGAHPFNAPDVTDGVIMLSMFEISDIVHQKIPAFLPCRPGMLSATTNGFRITTGHLLPDLPLANVSYLGVILTNFVFRIAPKAIQVQSAKDFVQRHARPDAKGNIWIGDMNCCKKRNAATYKRVLAASGLVEPPLHVSATVQGNMPTDFHCGEYLDHAFVCKRAKQSATLLRVLELQVADSSDHRVLLLDVGYDSEE